MDQLKKLLESSLLNEETKTVLKEQWESAVAANRAEVETEYAEKFNAAKAELNKNALSMVEEAISEELGSIAEELAEARNLEVEYAEKLQQFKESYDEKQKEMVEAMVAESVQEEITELKEDIDFAKKHQFGISLFESFRETYGKMFGESDVDVHKQLEEATGELETLRREKVINGLLESVSGEKRDVVATILEGVATDKLEAKFESLRPVLLKESEEEKEEKEEKEELEEGKDEKGEIILENVDEDDKTQSAVYKQIQRSLNRFKN